MSKLNKNLPNKIYKIFSCGVAPGMRVVFNKAEELCRRNPNFHSSLVISLLKSEVAKETSPKGSNAKTDVVVLNFIHFIRTDDKKAAQVVSANIGGPEDLWFSKMNTRERKDCIIDISEEKNKVAQRMEAVIEKRNIQGCEGTCFLAIDATKVAQVLEVSHAYGAIIGEEYPHNLIPIDGMDNIKVQDILDGK